MSKSDKPSMNWLATDLHKEWKRFKQHCEFTFKGPLNAKSEVEKVNYLMTYIGDKGREIYGTFTWTPAVGDNPAEQDTLAGVYAKYEGYVAPKKNQIRATVNFHRRKQNEGEKFDAFVTDLRLLVKDCGYTDEDRMLRDAIVCNSLHSTVREKCLDKGDDLTLDMAIAIGQNYETSQESLKLISKEEDAKVHSIKARHSRAERGSHGARPKIRQSKRPPQDKGHHKKPSSSRGSQSSQQTCHKCGYSATHSKCPARNQKCSYCHKLHHFAAVCRKRIATHAVDETYITSGESSSDDEVTHLISSVGDLPGEDWYENIEVAGQTLRVQIDTGAVQSIMPYHTFKALCPHQKPEPTKIKFESYSNHPLEIAGCATLTTKYKHRAVDIKYYIVKANRKPPLLSGVASQKLHLIERIHSINNYPELKTTTGTLPGTYSLKIDPTVKPVVHPPRKQPQALRSKIVDKLAEMARDGHITKVTEPTDWVSSMVTVVKNGKVRICLDPKDLNKAIRRERYPIPTVEEVVSAVPNTKIFSVIDAKSGFLQIKLDYESSLLTTFNTPVGRYRWLRLPFGIKSAPEIFQRIMDTMLEGISGARAVMDDILVAGRDEAHHDHIMKQVVKRATDWNLKLNFDKCQIKKREVKYVGHLLTEKGLRPDPEKVRAVQEMPAPTSKEDVRRLLGMVQYLAKFIPNLSEVDAPLRELTQNKSEFIWEQPQQQSFDKLRQLCSQAPVLAYYNVNKNITIQCDASSYAIGGVLLQESQPIAYTSRALTAAEKAYAQIEKEMLAIVHCCKKFHHYVFGKPVTVESDHKPLQAIYSKPLLSAPMRLQSMLLRLQPYDLNVTYKPGKEIPIGDALSRANLPDSEPDMKPVAVNMTDFIAVTPTRYAQFQTRTADELNELHAMILKGWPDSKQEVPHSIREFWNSRDELSVADGVVYKGMRIVVPPSMRPDMLAQIHASHLGIVKCKQRAREALYWPGMSDHITNVVKDCHSCNANQNSQAAEPLKPTQIPDLPWIELGCDVFDYGGEQYVVLIDYYSKFIEVDKLPDLSTTTLISALRAQFARHGIPEKMRSDNGPQYSSSEFHKFCRELGILHITSSPYHPQSNGEAERAVQIVKRLWKKCTDKQLALLDYRTTPLASCNLSPAQLLMGRRPRNLLPAARSLLQPKTHSTQEVKQLLKQKQLKQMHDFNRKAGHTLHPLRPGDPVRMAPFPGARTWQPATVLTHHSTPRSYVVEHNGRKYRRNRKHLRLSTHKANKPQYHASFNPEDAPVPMTQQSSSHSSNAALRPAAKSPKSPTTNSSPKLRETTTIERTQETTPTYVTRSGRVSRPPRRLDL